ncbi:MAG TPA: CDP-alcohol phosphatidyltransferase family protein, partial [Polyangiaceae bacterium]|nr:CDP-alcohol phosphatidyltransferase family protein [Polyangiaceae bacterium]
LAAFVVAVLAATLIVYLPGYFGVLAGVIVFQLSYVLDCVDGMLARWRGIQSTRGHLLDFLMDEIKAFVILGAVAVRLFLEKQDPRYLLLGIAGLVFLATGIAITTFQRRPEIVQPAPPPSAEPAPPPSPVARVVRGIERVAKFFIHYPSYILYAALLGRLELYFFPYVAVNALYAARAWTGVALRFGRE